ncbi:MAG: response regulator [Lentisphaerae bacterium]|jgi:DNA-binding response OmpR family regulator|nr:response regulator [Lentisphaerota bacterium]MBT4818137.1 response regulator [Lentisphaerota bacterium]MBT5606363.1 response regulator [Lentisphaerota bacterium]MBT7056782.1 response regulator [Lentisphaerota bacterium]MBT7840387.1 response regulator [Lentisphaerota bacterium]
MAYVLIIDDDEDFALAAQMVLVSHGHEVDIRTTTKNAIVNMERRPPDLVILDVMFPEDASAGFALARRMRHFSSRLADIPILLLTAVNSRFPLGFTERDLDDEWLPGDGFLEKPTDLGTLTMRVSTMLAPQSRLPEATQRGSHASSPDTSNRTLPEEAVGDPDKPTKIP